MNTNTNIAQPLATNTAPLFSGPDGKLTTDFGGNDSASSVALSNGIIVVAGSSTGSFALVRYTSTGSLDTTFDGDGKTTTQMGSGQSLVVQSDQKMILVGSNGSNFALARYHTDGRLDTTFDGDGKVSTSFGGFGQGIGYGRSVALQVDGKILVAGSVNSSIEDSNFALARYNTNGSLDTSFDDYIFDASSGRTPVFNSSGNVVGYAPNSYTQYVVPDGKVTTDFSYLDSGYSIAMQTDGKVVVAGISNGNFALTRYNSSGSLDNTFGTVDNFVFWSDGAAVATGTDNNGNALFLYERGKVATDFGGNDIAYNVITQADGTVLVAGSSDNQFALARYTSNGSLDTTFDTDGKVTTAFGSEVYGYSMALQADGKIIVVGSSDGQFALARYATNGSLDTTFDGDGKVTTVFDGAASAASVTVQSDGKILVAGTITNAIGQSDFALARYNSNGSLDSTFSPTENTLDNRPTYAEPSATESSVPVVLDCTVHIFDAELAKYSYAGATLILTRQGGANVDDVFSAAANSGLLPFRTGLALWVDGASIGSVMSNGGGKLEIKFNTGATQTLLDKALSNIAYSNTSDDPPANVTIDWIFNDGNTTSQGTGGALAVTGQTVVKITAQNDAPVLNTKALLIDQILSTDEPFSYTFAADTFTDPDLDVLSYSAITNEGALLPLWLEFDAATRTLSGMPLTAHIGALDVRITATDSAAASVSDVMHLSIHQAPTVITGTNSADQFKNTANDEIFNAGLGTDTVVLSGKRSDYTLTKTGTGWKIESSAQGLDRLNDVERLQFTDTTFALDINGNAGQAYRLYQAVFDRAPDATGLGYWIYYLDQGHTLTEVAANFMDSAEFKMLYGQNPTHTALVSRLYQNTLHRLPEQAGLDFWVAELDSAHQTVSQVLAGFSESTENQNNLVGVIGNGFGYTPFGG